MHRKNEQFLIILLFTGQKSNRCRSWGSDQIAGKLFPRYWYIGWGSADDICWFCGKFCENEKLHHSRPVHASIGSTENSIDWQSRGHHRSLSNAVRFDSGFSKLYGQIFSGASVSWHSFRQISEANWRSNQSNFVQFVFVVTKNKTKTISIGVWILFYIRNFQLSAEPSGRRNHAKCQTNVKIHFWHFAAQHVKLRQRIMFSLNKSLL